MLPIPKPLSFSLCSYEVLEHSGTVLGAGRSLAAGSVRTWTVPRASPSVHPQDESFQKLWKSFWNMRSLLCGFPRSQHPLFFLYLWLQLSQKCFCLSRLIQNKQSLPVPISLKLGGKATLKRFHYKFCCSTYVPSILLARKKHHRKK